MPPARPADKSEPSAPAAQPQPMKGSSIEVGFLKDVFAEITGGRATVPGRDGIADAANDRSGR